MYINSVRGIGVNLYANSNTTNQKTESALKSFKNEVQKAKESREMMAGSSTSKWDGDLVISEPPNYSYYICDSSVSDKPKEKMTLNEYKQWFVNEMSKIQVSGYYRASFVGNTVITEEAFKEMKANPEWERTVLNMLREGYSVNGLPQRSYCYQVIGASPAETYGYTVPMNSSSSSSIFSGKTKSWWQIRREKTEEALREELEEVLRRQMLKVLQK